MKNTGPLPQAQKLSGTYRIEPGCLGPKGQDHVNDFCNFAQNKIESLDSDYIAWIISPRNDKRLAEMQYQVVGKIINHTQADKYLAMFGKNLDEFEGRLSDKVATLIAEFMHH